MEIRRFFVNQSDICNGQVRLEGDEFAHFSRVLRYKVGYKAIVCANDGVERLCTVKEIGKSNAILCVDEERVADVKRKRVTLFAGLLKNNKLDFAIQKAVELGVDEIVPFVSRNCAETKFSRERAEKIALEAAKQCGSAYLTRVCELATFDEVLNRFKEFDKVFFAYEAEKKNRIKDCDLSGENFALVIGAEGGFTKDETELAKYNGACVVTLGRRILRAETASIVSCALLLDVLGELDYE